MLCWYFCHSPLSLNDGLHFRLTVYPHGLKTGYFIYLFRKLLSWKDWYRPVKFLQWKWHQNRLKKIIKQHHQTLFKGLHYIEQTWVSTATRQCVVSIKPQGSSFFLHVWLDLLLLQCELKKMLLMSHTCWAFLKIDVMQTYCILYVCVFSVDFKKF